MSSHPRIENVSDGPGDTEEAFVFPDSEEDEDGQRVDSIRVTRLTRALARWAGALSETPHRSDSA